MNIADLSPTHHVATRDSHSTVNCRIKTTDVAIERGSDVAILFQTHVLNEYEFVRDELNNQFTRIDGEHRFWPEYGEGFVEYHGDLPNVKPIIDAFFQIAVEHDFWLLSELVVFEEGSWILHLPTQSSHTQVANVNINSTNASFENELNSVLDGLPAALILAGTIASWNDNKHWFEIKSHLLCVYQENPSNATHEEKEYYMSHQCYSLTNVENIVVDDSDKVINITWKSDSSNNTIERVFNRVLEAIQSEPPSDLVFENSSEFERISGILIEITEQFWSESLSSDGT